VGESGQDFHLPGRRRRRVLPSRFVYVREVERAPDAHLPDPVDPHKIGQGIGVYFTTPELGTTSILPFFEDRKFKTGPAGTGPNKARPGGVFPIHFVTRITDPRGVDVEARFTLASVKLKFIENAGPRTWSDAT